MLRPMTLKFLALAAQLTFAKLLVSVCVVCFYFYTSPAFARR